MQRKAKKDVYTMAVCYTMALSETTNQSTTTPNTITTMQIHIYTQICENYGAHDWDGDGQCPQYWKNKGGKEYIVTEVRENATRGALGVIVALAKQAFSCERHDDYFHEYVIGWEAQPDGTMSRWERDQLEYDGGIDSPSKRKTVQEIFA